MNVYRWLAKDSTRQRHQAAVREIEIDAADALQTLDYQMKGDIADVLPDNEILKAAKKRGVSRLIKKIRQRERLIPQGPGKEPIREVNTEIELYGAQGAAKHLSGLLMGSQGEASPLNVIWSTKEDRALKVAELISRAGLRLKAFSRTNGESVSKPLESVLFPRRR